MNNKNEIIKPSDFVYSTGVSHPKIRLSGVSINTSTGDTGGWELGVPDAVAEQEPAKRDLTASKMVIEKSKEFEAVQHQLPEAIHNIIEGKSPVNVIYYQPKYYIIQGPVQRSIIGGEGHSVDIDFNHIWQENADSVNVQNLLDEFEVLRSHLSKNIDSPEQAVDVAEVVYASQKLEHYDGPAMLRHVRNLKGWVLDEIKKGGFPLILQIIQLLS